MEVAAQDTTLPPVVDGQEPVAPQDTAPAVEPQSEPVVEPTPEPEPVMTLQQVQSWVGRRDAQLRNEFKEGISQILQAVQSRPTPGEEAPDATTQLLNDPEGFMSNFINKQKQVETQKTQAFITSAARIFDSDPDFTDNKLGMEVIEQMKSIPMNHNLPPDVAADLVVSKAKAQVLAARVRTKTNPLAGNKPASVPLGTVSPSAAPSPAKPRVKVEDEVAAFGKRMGFSDDEIQAILKD